MLTTSSSVNTFCASTLSANSIKKGNIASGLMLILLPVKKIMYNNGNTNSVRNVAVNSPPITTVARGFCTSAPAPCDNAIGRNPSEATVAVISTGRNLIFVPSIILSVIFSIPSFFNWLNVAIKTIPLRTATPNKAINPIPAEILNGMPRANNANTPPMALIGMAVKMSNAWLAEPNVRYKSKKIRASATGTAIISRFDAA